MTKTQRIFTYAGWISAGILVLILLYTCNNPKYVTKVVTKERAYDSVKKAGDKINDSLNRIIFLNSETIKNLGHDVDRYRATASANRKLLNKALDSIDILKEVLPTDTGSTGRWISSLLLQVSDLQTYLKAEESANDSAEYAHQAKDSLNEQDKSAFVEQLRIMKVQLAACDELVAALKVAEKKEKNAATRKGIVAAVIGFFIGWGGGRIGR